MKYILIMLLVLMALQADKIKRKTIGCPSLEILKKVPVDTGDNYLDINTYVIVNSCVILSKKSSIEVLGYNANNTIELYHEIIYKKTGQHLFLKSSAVIVEQYGKKSTWRF